MRRAYSDAKVLLMMLHSTARACPTYVRHSAICASTVFTRQAPVVVDRTSNCLQASFSARVTVVH